jgi:hypothetical protein
MNAQFDAMQLAIANEQRVEFICGCARNRQSRAYSPRTSGNRYGVLRLSFDVGRDKSCGRLILREETIGREGVR